MTVPAMQKAREKEGMLTGLRGSRRSSGRCWSGEGRTGSGVIPRRSWERRRLFLVAVEDDAVDHQEVNKRHSQERKDTAKVCA